MSGHDFQNDISALGLRAAAQIVENMLSLSRQLSEVRFPLAPFGSDDTGNGGADSGPADRRQQMRQLRADAERLIELYADWTRTLLDGAARLVDAEEAPAELLIVEGLSGEVAEATAWVHVLDGPPAPPARLHATDLVAHDGDRVASDAVCFDPALVSTTDRGSSIAITVTVALPAGARGTYHGHVLADGLPEVCLPLRVEAR